MWVKGVEKETTMMGVWFKLSAQAYEHFFGKGFGKAQQVESFVIFGPRYNSKVQCSCGKSGARPRAVSGRFMFARGKAGKNEYRYPTPRTNLSKTRTSSIKGDFLTIPAISGPISRTVFEFF
jgi:hypothetical protein